MGIDYNSEFMQEGHALRYLYIPLRNDAHQKHDLQSKKFLSPRCSSNCNFFNGSLRLIHGHVWITNT
jgi:hypothetical protein